MYLSDSLDCQLFKVNRDFHSMYSSRASLLFVLMLFPFWLLLVLFDSVLFLFLHFHFLHYVEHFSKSRLPTVLTTYKHEHCAKMNGKKNKKMMKKKKNGRE